MSIAQPNSGPIPYQPLSDVDFEQPTAIIWPILAISFLRFELYNSDASLHPEAWHTYATALNSVSDLFGYHTSHFDWGCLPSQHRRYLYQDLSAASAAFTNTFEKNLQDKAMYKYVLRWFEAYNTQLDIDNCAGMANMSDHVPIFDVANIPAGVADLLRELTGSIVKQHVGALQEIKRNTMRNMEAASLQDAVMEMVKISETCVTDICEAIKVYIIVKIDREFLSAQSLPANFLDRITNSIKSLLETSVRLAFEGALQKLGAPEGDAAEAKPEFTAACMNALFFDIGVDFSYQSRWNSWAITPRGEEFDDDCDFRSHDASDFDGNDAPMPEYVANHQFEQYRDDDWFAGQLQLRNTQDVLLGPQNVTVDQVSMLMENKDEGFCELCGEFPLHMRKLKSCCHALCADCLKSQLEAKHACRYKCPYCRAEFFPDVLEI